MINFYSDFVSYFLPDLDLPAWAQLMLCIILVYFFFNIIFKVLDIFGGRK